MVYVQHNAGLGGAQTIGFQRLLVSMQCAAPTCLPLRPRHVMLQAPSCAGVKPERWRREGSQCGALAPSTPHGQAHEPDACAPSHCAAPAACEGMHPVMVAASGCARGALRGSGPGEAPAQGLQQWALESRRRAAESDWRASLAPDSHGPTSAPASPCFCTAHAGAALNPQLKRRAEADIATAAKRVSEHDGGRCCARRWAQARLATAGAAARATAVTARTAAAAAARTAADAARIAAAPCDRDRARAERRAGGQPRQ